MTTDIVADAGRRSAFLLAVLCAVHCGHAGSSRPVSAQEAKGTNVGTLDAKVDALRTAFPDAVVELDAGRARVTRIRGLSGTGAPGNADAVATSVLRTPAVAAALGVSPDLRELCPPVSRADPQIPGYAVVRMQQCIDGITLLGAELVMNVQVSPAPRIETLTSSLTLERPRTTTPAISAAAAATAADIAVAGTSTDRGRPPEPAPRPAAVSSPELVFFVPALFQLQGPIRLCWLVRRNQIAVLVDATDGTVVHQYSDVQRGL